METISRVFLPLCNLMVPINEPSTSTKAAWLFIQTMDFIAVLPRTSTSGVAIFSFKVGVYIASYTSSGKVPPSKILSRLIIDSRLSIRVIIFVFDSASKLEGLP